MATASALLRSADATRSKVRSQQVAEATYEYSQSAKTYADFVDFSKFIEGQAAQTSSPSEQLTYTKAIDSARSAYVSNEIQRQTISVLEGRSTNMEKYDNMVGLYQNAIANGDQDLAQSLVSQLDSLSVRIQNEAESAQRTAKTMALNGVKTLDGLVKLIQKGDQIIELPDGNVIKPFAMLNSELQTLGKSEQGQFFREAYDTAQALQGVIADAYQGATVQEAVDKIEEKYGDVLTGDKAFTVGGQKLSLQDLELAYKSEQANNPLYHIESSYDPSTGQQSFALSKNKIDDFVWIRNDNGTYQAVQTRTTAPSQYQTLDTLITDQGSVIGPETQAKSGVGSIEGGTGQAKRDSSLSIRNRLANMGYQVVGDQQGSDGTFMILSPEGQTYQATIQPDGTIRYFGAPGQYSGGQAGLYELNVLQGGLREVAPDEASIFGTKSKFGGMLSKASDVGVRIIDSLAGVTKPLPSLLSPAARITNLANDFSATATPATTSVLQGAENTRAAQQLTANPVTQYNLNQIPVQQFAQNGMPIRQLTVDKPPQIAKPLQVVSPIDSIPNKAAGGNLTVGPTLKPGTVTVAKPTAQPKLTVR